MNYNPQALRREFWLTPYYACILHLASIQQSLGKKKKKGKKWHKGRANLMCELQLPSLLGNRAWLFQAVIQQGCMCVLFGPIPRWLLQIVHQLSLSEGACLSLTDSSSRVWISHGSLAQFLGHEVACFQLGWLCAELWRWAEVPFSSNRHFRDSTQMKIMWLTLFPICIALPPPYRITMKLIIERWSLWETTFSSRNIFETGCSSLGLAHSLLDFK